MVVVKIYLTIIISKLVGSAQGSAYNNLLN